MKKLFTHCLSSIAACLLLTGCGGAGGLFAPAQTVTPQIIQTIRTNTVAQIVADPTGVAVATNFSLIVATNFATNFVTNISYSVSTNVNGYIAAANVVNSVIPTPWQPAVTLGLSALTIILGLIAKFKSDKASVLPAIIAGVEAAGNSDVKKSIQTMALAQGVEKELSYHVQNLT